MFGGRALGGFGWGLQLLRGHAAVSLAGTRCVARGPVMVGMATDMLRDRDVGSRGVKAARTTVRRS